MSASFHISCGVRQGGVISPVLFSVYVDELIVKLRSSGYGIYIGSLFCACIFMQMTLHNYHAAAMVFRSYLIYIYIYIMSMVVHGT